MTRQYQSWARAALTTVHQSYLLSAAIRPSIRSPRLFSPATMTPVFGLTCPRTASATVPGDKFLACYGMTNGAAQWERAEPPRAHTFSGSSGAGSGPDAGGSDEGAGDAGGSDDDGAGAVGSSVSVAVLLRLMTANLSKGAKGPKLLLLNTLVNGTAGACASFCNTYMMRRAER